MSRSKSNIGTAKVRELLAVRYALPEWLLMEEVAPRTGGGTRYADAVAFNLWESRGHSLLGFEIKVSRSDWLRELKAPEKAEPVLQYCDFWFVVAPPDVVADGELPMGWGLIEAQSTRLVMRNAGTQREAAPLTRGFFASLMRRGFETVDAVAARKVRDAVNDARVEVETRVKHQVELSTRKHVELRKVAEEFKEITGLDFQGYMREESLETVRLAHAMGEAKQWLPDGFSQGILRHNLDNMTAAADQLRAALAAFGDSMKSAADVAKVDA